MATEITNFYDCEHVFTRLYEKVEYMIDLVGAQEGSNSYASIMRAEVEKLRSEINENLTKFPGWTEGELPALPEVPSNP